MQISMRMACLHQTCSSESTIWSMPLSAVCVLLALQVGLRTTFVEVSTNHEQSTWSFVECLLPRPQLTQLTGGLQRVDVGLAEC